MQSRPAHGQGQRLPGVVEELVERRTLSRPPLEDKEIAAVRSSAVRNVKSSLS